MLTCHLSGAQESFWDCYYLLSQCTDTITEPNDNQEVNSFLPSEYGDVPLPGRDAENSAASTSGSDAMAGKNGNKKYNSSTIALLKEYIDKHKKVHFAAAAGRWKPNKQKYKYKLLPLHFPDRMVQEANGEVIYYDYHLADTSRTVRKLQAIIPASKKAAESMDEWLKMKGGKRIDPSEERTTGSSDSNPILSKKEECDREYVEGTCWGWYPETGWGYTSCDEIIVCDTAPDPGSGEEWPDDEGPPAEDDPDSDDSGCTTCGAGGDGTGEEDDDDSSDEEFCISELGKKVPCGELEPEPEPCETNGEHPALDTQNIQDGLNNLWQKSLDSPDEEGAFIYPNGYGGYNFDILTDNLIIDQGYNFIEFGIPANAPDSMIFVHTHPTRETLEQFGITNKYQHHPSDEDYDAMESDKIIKGYILDPDMIIEFNSSEITDTLDRCGY